MKLIASALALDLLLALTQCRDGARLAELASALDVPLTSAQRAVRVLLADGVAERESRVRPRYRLRPDRPGLGVLIDLAFLASPSDRTVPIVLRASPAVEFAARDREGYIVVEHPLADPRDEVALDDALLRLERAGHKVLVLLVGHHEAIARVREDATLRSRAARAVILKGSLARSFPGAADVVHRVPRGAPSRRRPARRPGGLPPVTVSRRGLAGLARRYALRRIRLFGSTARGAARPSSDVDVLVEPAPGSSLSLTDLDRLEAGLEALFDRHVDVVTPGGLDDRVRAAADREGVTIYE